MFVTFEGIDGAGKSTQARLLAEDLGADTVLLREPGGTPAGERVRELIKDPDLALSPRAELMLFCAARAELVETVIRPALRDGRRPRRDRFADSTLAYQGIVRGLGPELVATLNAAAVSGCVPDRTVLLRIEPERSTGRAADRLDFGTDRFEREGLDFQRRLAAAFDEIASAEPDRFRVVDGSGSVAEVQEAVRTAVGVGAPR